MRIVYNLYQSNKIKPPGKFSHNGAKLQFAKIILRLQIPLIPVSNDLLYGENKAPLAKNVYTLL